MALNYLLCPTFQVINTGGKPATGGYIECYVHGTRYKYYCYSDWEGTLHPFQIPLDSLGANIVLADEQNSYDVYIYNRYGSLLMSRYKVKPSGGGGIASITSSDGSINVNYTENGIDLTLADDKASCLKAGAQNLSADGIFTWFKKESVGNSIHCDQGFIVLDDGWYHFTATVRLDWRQIPVNETGRITLSTTLTSDVMEFDYSYAHDETFELSGDIYIAPSSTQYIQSGRGFVLSVFGMKTGMVAEMVGLDIHTILGQGAAGGEKNVHRLLRWYTNASEADEQHPVGDWLHDLDSEDPDDPSGHPRVTADQLFAWYHAGQNFELYEVDGQNGQLGWSAIYRMVTWQDQSDWWSQFAPTPGKACRLEFFRMGMYSTPYRGGLIAYIRYKDEDYMRLYEIMPGQSIWMAEYQEKLPYYARDWHAGDFLRVKQDGSDLEWVPLSGVAISGSYNDLSDVPAHLVQDADYVHTDNNFTDGDKSKLDGIESGAQVNVQSDWTEADSSEDSFIRNKPDLSVYATDTELSDGLATKQDTLTAGNNIAIQNNVISATVPPQEQSDWTETDSSDVSYIKNKPSTKRVYAGQNISITEDANGFTISAPNFAQVQADWNESDSSDPSFIQNKPDLSIYAETANLATVATTGDYSDLVNKPTIPAAQVNSDWNASSGVAEILNKPNLSTVATTGDYNDLTNKPSIPAAQVNADWNSSSGVSEILNKPTLAAVATSGDYSDLSNTPSIPTATSDLTNDSGYITLSDVPAQVQSDWTEADSNDPAYIQNKPTLATVATTGDYTDLSNTPSIPTATSDLTNDSGYITLSDVPAQVQSDWTESDSSDPSYIENKPTLAAVATSGDYSDLSNTPSIPTATSDLTNDSGYITLSDVPTQVQSDWTEADSNDPAYIAHKPTLAAVATSGDYGDLSNAPTINNVPAVTSSDDAKVLKASYTGGVGSYSWETETDTTYSAGTGIDITSGTISVENPLPASTSAEAGKVLKVDSNGDPTWATGGGGGGGVNADWTEDDPLEPSYIENKPTPKTLTAGTGISIVDSVSSVTISSNVTAPVQDVTVNGTSVLSNGVAAVSVDQTYDATSANAQSGVAVADAIGNLGTNLTAAQIQSLKEALGVDETVLFESAAGVGSGTAVQLSEAYTNFEKVKFIYKPWNNMNSDEQPIFGTSEPNFHLLCGWTTSNNYAIFLTTYTASDSTNLSVTKIGLNNVNGNGWATTNANFKLYKVVGIHRIASN